MKHIRYNYSGYRTVVHEVSSYARYIGRCIGKNQVKIEVAIDAWILNRNLRKIWSGCTLESKHYDYPYLKIGSKWTSVSSRITKYISTNLREKQSGTLT